MSYMMTSYVKTSYRKSLNNPDPRSRFAMIKHKVLRIAINALVFFYIFPKILELYEVRDCCTSRALYPIATM